MGQFSEEEKIVFVYYNYRSKPDPFVGRLSKTDAYLT